MPVLKKIAPQKGQILALTVILLPLFLIMLVFIIEAVFLYIKQSQLQSAADEIVLAKITDKPTAEKIVALNRTVDFKEVDNIKFPTLETDAGNIYRVVLKESVIPVFEIFGENEITTIMVCSKAEDGKLVSWDL